uniref:Uncharacterized protein n=1 Tax=Anguilla anguilla TaxID=7936 RepID=A0A0E9W8L8_ANGAN
MRSSIFLPLSVSQYFILGKRGLIS